jgi:hypothetical protein
MRIKTRFKWENARDIKFYLTESGCLNKEWLQLAQENVLKLTLVNKVRGIFAK